MPFTGGALDLGTGRNDLHTLWGHEDGDPVLIAWCGRSEMDDVHRDAVALVAGLLRIGVARQPHGHIGGRMVLDDGLRIPQPPGVRAQLAQFVDNRPELGIGRTPGELAAQVGDDARRGLAVPVRVDVPGVRVEEYPVAEILPRKVTGPRPA